MSVDVAINVFGKPFQTAVTLLSLLKYSGEHINRIYLIKERVQPTPTDLTFLYELLGDRVTVYTPDHWLWIRSMDASKLLSSPQIKDDGYRWSIRYQFAWERSTAGYLFLTHNDVLYKGDIIKGFLDKIGDSIAIGEIGQCWNCPAHSAGVCNGDKYFDYRPSIDEVVDLYNKFPSHRPDGESYLNHQTPWPLPECRLNEWAALIDLEMARPETIPIGDSCPFGLTTVDTGTQWFRDLSLKGYSFANHPITEFAKHGWTDEGAGGHPSLSDQIRYENGEEMARSLLISEFGIDPAVLHKTNGFKLGWHGRMLLRQAYDMSGGPRLKKWIAGLVNRSLLF